MNHDLAANRIDGGNVLGREFFLGWGTASGALHGLDPAVESRRNGIPEVQEGILFKANVHKHGLQPVFNVADLPLENSSHDIAVALPFNRVLLEFPVLQEGDAFLEFFTTDDQLDLRACFLNAQEALDGFNDIHGVVG